jgi:hypothetical protein
MAVQLDPSVYDPPSPSVRRNTDFTLTIDIVKDGGEVINNISIVAIDLDPGVSISASTANENVTISGNYQAAYPGDEGQYVLAGSSDLIMDPIVVNSTADIPADQDLFSWIQDDTPTVDKEYTVTVQYTDEDGAEQTLDLQLLHRVNNDWESGTLFLRNYFGT